MPRTPAAATYRIRQARDDTAALGIFFDQAYRGPGLKVDEIIEKGPLVIAKSKITPGMIIEKIDGEAIAPGTDWCPLLNRKAGRPMLLSVFDPAKNARFDETVKPINIREQEELLYQRWVKSRRELTDKLSGGRLGYVHVRGMDDESYRDTFSEVLGRASGKEAFIVDTRFNGGGNLHDELATLLSGKISPVRAARTGPRRGTLNKWDKKSVGSSSARATIPTRTFSRGRIARWHRQAHRYAGARHGHGRVVGDAAGPIAVLRHPGGRLRR